MAGRLSVVCLSSGQRCLPESAGRQTGLGRRLTDLWIVWVVQNLARHTPDVCDALPDIGRFIGDQIAMKNGAPGLKMTRQPKGVPWGPGRKCLYIRRKLIAS